MKIKKFHYIILFFLTLIFTVSGFSSFVLTNHTDEFSGTSDTMRTVNVYHQTNEIVSTYAAYETLPSPIDIGGGSYSSSQDSDAKTRYNAGQNNQYNKSEVFSDSTGKYYTYDINEVKPSREGLGIPYFSPYKYTVTWETYKQYTHYLTEQLQQSDLTTQTPKTISIKNGSYLNPVDVLSDYENAGFYTSSSFNTFFDFSKPITSDTNIYIKYIKSDESITNKINNISGTVNLFDSNRNSGGIGSDVKTETGAYDSTSKTAFLDTATIISGSTLNLTYGSGVINLSPYEGAVDYDSIDLHRNTGDLWVSTNVTNTSSTPNVCALKVKLTGDLTVKGNLNIGAKIGSCYPSSNYKYSYIIGEYTELDLNGHNLIIENGGVVKAFGLISDTLGMGKIIVKNGGKLISTFTIFDGRGGNQTTFGYAKGQSPFTQYCSPYITAKMEFNYGSTFTAYLKVDIGNLGISNAYLNFISNSGTDAIFIWNSSDTNGKIYINPYTVSDLYSSNAYANNINKDDLYKRFEIIADSNLDLYNAKFEGNVQVSALGLSISENIDMYLSRSGMPISPVFDIIIKKNRTITINYDIIFYPGSSLFAEKGSTIHFKPYGEFKYTGKTVATKTIPEETKYLAGSIIAHVNNLSHYNTFAPYSLSCGVYANELKTTYFNKFKIANVKINGTLSFDSSIDTSNGKYKIAGPIDLIDDNIKTIFNNKNLINTYYLKGEQYGAVWFNNDKTAFESNNSNSYVLVVSYETPPLISYGKAYIYDSTFSIEGTYDKITGIITSGNEKYILKPNSNNIFQGGTGGSYQDKPQDRELTPTKISSVSTYGIVNDGTSNYVFFGGIFVPVSTITSDTEVTALLNRFNSNNTSSLLSTSNVLHTNNGGYSKTLTYKTDSSLWDVSA